RLHRRTFHPATVAAMVFGFIAMDWMDTRAARRAVLYWQRNALGCQRLRLPKEGMNNQTEMQASTTDVLRNSFSTSVPWQKRPRSPPIQSQGPFSGPIYLSLCVGRSVASSRAGLISIQFGQEGSKLTCSLNGLRGCRPRGRAPVSGRAERR